jgi:hypothetical protein
VLAAAAVLVLTGLAHGLRSDRWGVAAEVQAAAARLDKVPAQVGDWEGTPTPLDPQSVRVAQAAGYCSLSFFNRISTERASLLLLCGRPGAIGSHTPQVCFQGLGLQMQGAPVRQQVPCGGQTAEFWTALFVRPDPVPETIRIWWAWGTGGQWQASDAPRLTYASQAAIYKLYVTSTVRPGAGIEEDSGRKLLEAVLPELAAGLSPSP